MLNQVGITNGNTLLQLEAKSHHNTKIDEYTHRRLRDVELINKIGVRERKGVKKSHECV